MPWRLASVAAVASMLPDLAVLAFRLGIPYPHPFGHRGASHSLAFAVLVALVVTTLGARIGASRAPISPRRLLSGRAGAVFESELLYVWLPCLLASAAPYAIRLWSRHSRKDDAGLA